MAVIECTVNQNVRDAGAANAAALCWQALELCHQHGTGLMVMPCPEIACLGASRQRPPGVSIGEAMRTRRCRQGVAALAVEVADRVQASLDAGTAVLAVLGGNERSPGCAVHDTTSSPEAEVGVFINALRAELQRRGLEIPFRGLRDADPAQLAEDLAWLRTQLGDLSLIHI